jgi:hypothetical protein
MKNKVRSITEKQGPAARRRDRQLLEARDKLLETLRRERRRFSAKRDEALRYLTATTYRENSGAECNEWLDVLEEAERCLRLLDGWFERAGERGSLFYPGLIERAKRAGMEEIKGLLAAGWPEAA